MELFDTLSLECFLAVTETGSFTRAAARVCKTQSALSQQIIKLEKKIGKELFRRGKKMTLTEEGETLLGYARKIVQLNRDAIDRFSQPELEGQVRFGLPEDFASVLLSDVLMNYSSFHPRIKVDVECDLTINLLERFKKQEFDLVLVKMNCPDDSSNGLVVLTEPLVWVGKPRLIEQNAKQAIPLVLAPEPCVYRARALHALEQIERKWRIAFSSHSYASKLAAVEAGMGITILPRNMVPDRLEIIPCSKSTPKLADTHISLLKHSNSKPAVNDFEEFVFQKLRI